MSKLESSSLQTPRFLMPRQRMARIDLSYAIILFNGSAIMQSCAGTWNKDFRDKLRRAYPIVQRVYHWMELNSVNIFPTQWMPSNFIALASRSLLSSVASMILEMEWLRQRLVVDFPWYTIMSDSMSRLKDTLGNLVTI